MEQAPSETRLRDRRAETRTAWFDGELVYLDEDGVSRFEPLVGCVRAGNEVRLHYQIFDMPWCGRRDLTGKPLLERKRPLVDALAGAPHRIRYTSHVAGHGQAFFDRVNALNLEGIVSKLADSRYYAGARTRDGLKIRCWRSYRYIDGGIECDGDGRLVSVIVGSPDGRGLRYEGRAEFGLHRLNDALECFQEADASPLVTLGRSRNTTWVAPTMESEVRALPRAGAGLLRHATVVSYAVR